MSNHNGAITSTNIGLGAIRSLNHRGLIGSNGEILWTVRNENYNGMLINCPSIIMGTRSTVKPGLDLGNYYFVKFERIPKERILNRFKNLGGNIQY
ncbi:hypothetical protein [Clostridium sp. ZS1]|uniref:hypothetical protein n=1 Tax=Clostridium sp. ZS1 TaxID=2949989 RepID=UPI00207A97FA|nr:hypothetical protein [Clostridium sp. ZS1]